MNENSSEIEIVTENDEQAALSNDDAQENLQDSPFARSEAEDDDEIVIDQGLFLSPEDSESEILEVEAPVANDAAAPMAEPGAPIAEPVAAEAAPAAAPAPAAEPAQVVAVDSARVTELESQVSSLSEERDDFKNKMMRVAADLENFRKRTAREKEEMRKYGIDRVVLELLPVLDNLERALQHGETTEDPSGLMDGVKMVHRQFITALQKHGVEGFESKGDSFDPTKHEAIQQVETSEHETGTVMEQYQKGYFLHDRLVRPALVSVAKFVEASGDVADEADSDSDSYVLEPKEPSDAPEDDNEEMAEEAANDESSGEGDAADDLDEDND